MLSPGKLRETEDPPVEVGKDGEEREDQQGDQIGGEKVAEGEDALTDEADRDQPGSPRPGVFGNPPPAQVKDLAEILIHPICLNMLHRSLLFPVTRFSPGAGLVATEKEGGENGSKFLRTPESGRPQPVSC